MSGVRLWSRDQSGTVAPTRRGDASGLKGSWFVSALTWNMGSFRRNPVTEVLRNETNDVVA